MSKENPDTRLALFNRQEGRGDIMTIPLEDGVRLASLSKKSFSDVLYSLFQWWTKGIDTPPKNDILRMLYEGMKEHQLQNAVKRGVNLEKWKKASDEAAERRKQKSPNGTKEPSGDQVDSKRTPSGSSIKDKEEDKDEVMSSLSSSLGLEKTRADAALFNPLSVEEAKKLSMMLAPPINADNYSAEDLDSYKELKEEVTTEDGAIKTVMSMTEEGKRDKKAVRFSRNTYRKFYRELGHDMFVRAFFRFDTNLYREYQKYDKDNMPPDLSKFPEDSIAKNPAASFTANLKRLEKAITVMKGSDLSDVSYD